MPPPAVADQASFAHVAEFFNSLLGLSPFQYPVRKHVFANDRMFAENLRRESAIADAAT